MFCSYSKVMDGFDHTVKNCCFKIISTTIITFHELDERSCGNKIHQIIWIQNFSIQREKLCLISGKNASDIFSFGGDISCQVYELNVLHLTSCQIYLIWTVSQSTWYSINRGNFNRFNWTWKISSMKLQHTDSKRYTRA